MPYQVELSARAEADLRHIFSFIHAADSEAAAGWFNRLEALIQSLATLPRRGKPAVPDPQLRYLLFGNKPHVYRILYRIDEDTQTIVIRTIRHGMREQLA